jgi:CBS domain-containing protein
MGDSPEEQLQEVDMRVKDVMHRGVVCVEPTATVKEIAIRMRDSDIGAIPVRAEGRLVGIITDRDVACRGVADKADIGKMTAQEIMSQHVVCCSPDDDLDLVVETMEASQIRRLPVTDSHKKIVGMLSLGDLSRGVSKDKSGEILRAVSGHHL